MAKILPSLQGGLTSYFISIDDRLFGSTKFHFPPLSGGFAQIGINMPCTVFRPVSHSTLFPAKLFAKIAMSN